MTKRRGYRKTYYNDIALRLAHRLFGVEHLHYGFFGPGINRDLTHLPVAQDAYAKHVIAAMPPDAHRIFDVGCGTGGIARLLVEAGKDVVSLAPDPFLTSRTQEATRGKARTITDFYENVSPTSHEALAAPFDLILMSESCQYVSPREAWSQHRRFLRPGGQVLISDFFKIRPVDAPHISKSGHPLDAFLTTARDFGFNLIRQEDITDAVAPTMDIYQDVLTQRVVPVVLALGEIVQRRFPRLYRLIAWKYGDKVEILLKKYQSQDAATFRKYKSYQLLLFRQVEGAALPSQSRGRLNS